jgi:hypothetical protein
VLDHRSADRTASKGPLDGQFEAGCATMRADDVVKCLDALYRPPDRPGAYLGEHRLFPRSGLSPAFVATGGCGEKLSPVWSGRYG